jgi:hypothetical protein
MLHQMSLEELATYLSSPGNHPGGLAGHAAKNPSDPVVVLAALRKAQVVAALEALRHGTPLYFSGAGQVVAENPVEVLANAPGRKLPIEALMRLAEQLVGENDEAKTEELKRSFLAGFYGGGP